MMWRRFAGSNGSCRAGHRRSAAEVIRRFGLAAATLLGTTGADAGQYDGYATAESGVVIGDYQPGSDRSVIVSDGEVCSPSTMVAGDSVGVSAPDAPGWFNYDYGPAIINRCLGPACPRWVGQADVLLLWQGNVPATPLLDVNTGIDPFPVALAGNQIPYVMGTGPRTAIQFNVDRCHAIEANYFNAGNFAANREFTAPTPGVEGGQLAWAGLGGYSISGIDSGTASTSGRIQSFELNWRRYNGRSITWLAGFRWIEWNDSLTINENWSDISGDGTDTLNTRSVNDLYGGQIGVDAILLTLFDVIRFNGVAKAGVYGNLNPSTTMSVESSDPNRIEPTTYTATGNSTGFFGEVGINGCVRLTDHLFWRAGYNFFWIGGVATSLNQVNAFNLAADPANPTGTLNLGGSVFLQGVNTGIEAIW